ncbi:MAG: hypothetical protein D8H97_35515 [Neisseria sp.]|nr:MAG: hypothetical protein D8H97_35515 [Neisseria sp.]
MSWYVLQNTQRSAAQRNEPETRRLKRSQPETAAQQKRAGMSRPCFRFQAALSVPSTFEGSLKPPFSP